MKQSSTRATVIVTPRERFGMAKASLESLYEATDTPFDLVYVDAGTPRSLRAWLQEQAEEKGFHLAHSPTVLPPNAARNLGFEAAKTDYIVFVDNDVIFEKGWLGALVDCADETGADVVAPLTCEGPAIHEVVHQAGGDYAVDRTTFWRAPRGERAIADIMHHHKARRSDLPPLERKETGVCEFHCVLVRRSIFDTIGPLDEEMCATKEHMDLCMSVHQAGGTVWFEPKSVVTYLFPTRQHAMEIGDFPFFLVRWSPEWQRRSLEHFRDKWGLKNDEYFAGRFSKLGWRRREGVSKTLLKKVPGLGTNRNFVNLGAKFVDPVAALTASTLVWAQDQQNRQRKRMS
ncbi:glycosyltransferase family 2 protein [Parvularcula lutaonensis]|uniref:Glycosyltransferase family 2 protein n=1 Tax=Parvularcula lutaonensis TaxID=491923 RepID=A0ABV7MAR7_9PROT|nr:glycosyltransferase [Parvularcula lutaonensis]GGY37988.1 glycosyl transferase [Parvularcula lutaonensis]